MKSRKYKYTHTRTTHKTHNTHTKHTQNTNTQHKTNSHNKYNINAHSKQHTHNNQTTYKQTHTNTEQNFSDLDHVLNLINERLLPTGYKLVHSDLPLLNKILVGQTILYRLDFWETKLHDCNTRSSGKSLLNPKTFLTEMTKLFEAEAISNFRCHCYPSRWEQLENLNQD